MSKGYLFLIGGKTDSTFIFNRLIELSGGKENSRIAIIPSLDVQNRNAVRNDEAFFIDKLQILKENIWTVPLNAFNEAGVDNSESKELAEKLARYNIVFFSGGDQRGYVDDLIKNKTDSLILNAVKKIYLDGGVLAASDSGVNILAKSSIAGGESEDTLLQRVLEKAGDDDDIELSIIEGLGLANNITFDTNAEVRGRLVRLSDAVALTENKFGIGISERTGVVVHPDRTIEVIGYGSVLLCDLSNSRLLNKPGEQLHAREINVTLLTHNDKYKLDTREFLPDPGKESILNTPYFDANDYHISLNVFKEYDTSQILINHMLDNEAKDVIGLMDYDKIFSHDDVSAFMRFVETDKTQAWFSKIKFEENAETVDCYSGTNVLLDVIPLKYVRETNRHRHFNVVVFGINNDVQVVVFENLKSLPVCDAKILIYNKQNKLIFRKGTDRYGRAVFHKQFISGEEYSLKITYDNEEKCAGFVFEQDMKGLCIY